MAQSGQQGSCCAERSIRGEIEQLEERLADAKRRLRIVQGGAPGSPGSPSPSPSASPATTSPTHFLLLLADSALPLGSFAFSSGLESYLAHSPPSSTSFSAFLASALSSYASTTLPFVLAAHRHPSRLAALDDSLDAATICLVARRASIAQGKALLGIWERSLRAAVTHPCAHETRVLAAFAALVRDESKAPVPCASAHLAPLFAVVCAAVGLTRRQTAYVFVLSHVKALVSAAVRAGVFGPYQAQRVLAGDVVQRWIDVVVDREWRTPVHEAGQTVPVMDLWVGRHELLYSRIFNS